MPKARLHRSRSHEVAIPRWIMMMTLVLQCPGKLTIRVKGPPEVDRRISNVALDAAFGWVPLHETNESICVSHL